MPPSRKRAEKKAGKKELTAPERSEPQQEQRATFVESQLKPLLFAVLTALTVSFVMAGGPRRLLHEARVRGWLGRPALPLSGKRTLLIVGTMGSGTTQRAHELRALALEVGHEASDSREALCRDATVSWAHGMRFVGAGLSPAQRELVVSGLCSGPRFA